MRCHCHLLQLKIFNLNVSAIPFTSQLYFSWHFETQCSDFSRLFSFLFASCFIRFKTMELIFPIFSRILFDSQEKCVPLNFNTFNGIQASRCIVHINVNFPGELNNEKKGRRRRRKWNQNKLDYILCWCQRRRFSITREWRRVRKRRKKCSTIEKWKCAFPFCQMVNSSLDRRETNERRTRINVKKNNCILCQTIFRITRENLISESVKTIVGRQVRFCLFPHKMLQMLQMSHKHQPQNFRFEYFSMNFIRSLKFSYIFFFLSLDFSFVILFNFRCWQLKHVTDAKLSLNWQCSLHNFIKNTFTSASILIRFYFSRIVYFFPLSDIWATRVSRPHLLVDCQLHARAFKNIWKKKNIRQKI